MSILLHNELMFHQGQAQVYNFYAFFHYLFREEMVGSLEILTLRCLIAHALRDFIIKSKKKK